MKSARPVLKIAPPTTRRLMKKMTVVLENCENAFEGSTTLKTARITGMPAPMTIGLTGCQIKRTITAKNNTSVIMACADILIPPR